MDMGRKASFPIAAVLVVGPILTLVGYKRWLDTRTFEPLDMPISLSRGHIKTTAFYINLKGPYRAEINVDYDATYTRGCQSEAWQSLRTNTIGYENGTKIGEVDGPEYGSVGVLNADKTAYYSLDIEVLADASCLNSAHPTLTVSNASDFPYGDLYQTGIWIVLISIVAGLGLLGYTLIAGAKREPKAHDVVDLESSRVTTALEPIALLVPKRFSTPPHFALFCSTVLVLVVFAMMVLTAPTPSNGLYISLNVAPNARYDLTPPVIVRIRQDPKLYPNLFVNSKRVEWSGLKDALRDELKIRPDWVIYVDGDPNLPFAHVAEVVGIGKELHAKVVLLTPATRQLVEPTLKKKKVYSTN